MSAYHQPVLLEKSVQALVTDPSGCYVDATFGGGGHSRRILETLSPEGRLMAFDRDADARANAPDDARFTLIHNNFRFVHNYVLLDAWRQATRDFREHTVDGILADLGVSSHQFDTAERGFSFRFDAPLDMRMNAAGVPGEEEKTAATVVNGYSQEEASWPPTRAKRCGASSASTANCRTPTALPASSRTRATRTPSRRRPGSTRSSPRPCRPTRSTRSSPRSIRPCGLR